MTPSRIPIQPKTVVNMTPYRVLASPKGLLIRDPVRLASPPQVSTSPVRVLKNESPPSPTGNATLSCSTPFPSMRDARMSLNKQFEAVETRAKTNLALTPKHTLNELDMSISNEPDVKTNATPKRSNELETISIVSVAQYSPYAVINSSQSEKQNTILSESTKTLCSNETFISQSDESGRLKPRFLTPYPKGAWEPSRVKSDDNQLDNSPEITAKPTNSLDLSGIYTMPVTPPTTVTIKV